ncbi:MAG: TadE/TadG family type IV pilus assembly protein [Bacillota bacterium]
MRDSSAAERGSILPLVAVVITIFIMIMAIAVDFARYIMVSEKLQTATDSAAIAAAMSGKRYVMLEIDRGSEEVSCPPGVEGPCCSSCPDEIIVSGREDDLIDNGGYRRYCCDCGCPNPQILQRWVEYENNGAEARSAAQVYFDLNKPKEMDSSAGGESYITSVNVYNNRSSRLYPSVVVQSHGKVKTLLMNFIDRMYPGTNASELESSRCAQGGTFYYDLDGKLHRAALEGCN